jgi:hypothetical protein
MQLVSLLKLLWHAHATDSGLSLPQVLLMEVYQGTELRAVQVSDTHATKQPYGAATIALRGPAVAA